MSELSGVGDFEERKGLFTYEPVGPPDTLELTIHRSLPQEALPVEAAPITASDARRPWPPAAMVEKPDPAPAATRPDLGPVANHYAELFSAVLADYVEHQPDGDAITQASDDAEQLLYELDGFVSGQGGGELQKAIRVELSGLDPTQLRAAHQYLTDFPDINEWPEDW